MDTQQVPFKVTAVRFVRAVKVFMTSEVGGKAALMFAGLVALFLALSGLNVANSYVGRNFMTAIANRQTPEFMRQAIFYIGVFAAFTIVAVVSRFIEERLALLWREFLTRRAVSLYLADRAYYHLDVSGQLTHPDQRIAEDMRVFTVTTLSFILMILNSSLTIIAFSGVLWSISPLLFAVAVVYAACGSYLTIALGRPLIKLNYDQLDKEASFRSGLIQVRENAEGIMLAHSEEQQGFRLLRRLDDAVANFRKVTAINRNVGFFTTGYNWLIQIIPALIIAPAYIRGNIDFGVITQSGAAFAMLVGAFSLVITQFQSISTFAAVVARLSSLMEAIERSGTPADAGIEVVEGKERLAYEQLTLLHATNSVPIVKDVSISIPLGTRVLITGPAQDAQAALFRATAGISFKGSGRIIRPAADDILFLPQRPYLPTGTLRQILVRNERAGKIPDDRIVQILRELNLEHVLEQAGGLNTEQNWEILLSPQEQQLLAFINILIAAPQFAFLDRLDATLGLERLHTIMRMLSESSITYINNAETAALRDYHDAVLECSEDGGWVWTVNRA
ncbi:ABC transporter ATP-binding protein/permease [Rhizobium ruizarguesonis]|jgi:putative ATP-binding cassette transporter|uniref:ABC transporter ATP-binding protein/permease n=1 Tax=Rhizobium ruizarguesonis TaxID=2081791 RepID=UPI000375CBB1|nr:SbmA/BacA-like family transporter [Rhizobium ruizarguesonis]MBY5834384.1 ABC transporter ATP-binding protein/permease [Rhizobium leguminosarum]QJS30003.1 ABC transporter ATP-binding protein/permease [Rhizobium leguminosarum bv. trifolii TA1]MBY5862628.1 ABC transporter ATP-binding protein/permease [Rhizobium leguminosarum]MBY5876985.1 ABC transporter ATP-binding protein/permease [Rhizobium leguminosarum]MBY5890454.1 ABC transporter ATP-binding protein/permease [Rhizobium leguminosarum]